MFMSLSGRVTWWEFAWRKYLERPFTGFGAYAGGRFAAMAEFGGGMTSSLHNTYMEVLLGSGPIGLWLIVTLIVALWFSLARCLVRFRPDTLPGQLAVECAGVFTMVTVLSVFSTTIIWHGSVDFMLVLAFVEFVRRYSSAPRYRREGSRSPQSL
jgi:O-antigen ligase